MLPLPVTRFLVRLTRLPSLGQSVLHAGGHLLAWSSRLLRREDGGKVPARLLMPAYRFDGVGTQALLRMCIMYLARETRSRYVHLPFLNLAHKDIEPGGSSISSSEWAERWERFFNLGFGEVQFSDVIAERGLGWTLSQVYDRRHVLGAASELSERDIAALGSAFRDSDTRGFYAVDLAIGKYYRELGISFDLDLVNRLRARYASNGYRPSAQLFDEGDVNVAIHLRRGDLVGGKYPRRLIPDAWYRDVINHLDASLAPMSIHPRYHVFTDGTVEDLESVGIDPSIMRSRVRCHTRTNTFDAFHYMTKADILIPSMSTFSGLASFYNTGLVLLDKSFTRFNVYGVISEVIGSSSRFRLFTHPNLDFSGIRVRTAGASA